MIILVVFPIVYPRGVRLKCYYAYFLVCCGCDTSYIVSVQIQCQASIYTISLCRGHSWRVRLAKQETLTPPGHLVSPLVCRGPWMSTVVLYYWCHSDSASVLLYFTFPYYWMIYLTVSAKCHFNILQNGVYISVEVPFYTPVFRRDVLWYGDVRPSVRPSVRPGLRPSVRPSQFSALFSYMLWHIDLKFCVSLYFYARKIKFECHQFPSLFAGVMLLFNFKLLQICSFPHFSPTCFDILRSNFVYDFVLMYHRASLSVVILLQFLLELCLFVNLEYSKYKFSALFSYMLWHIELKFCICLCFTVLQIKFECRQFASIFVGVMPLLELRILETHSFPHFSLTPFNILSWKFAYYFVFLYYRLSLSVVNLRLFWSYASFRT